MGVVVQLYCRKPGMPPGTCAAYGIALDGSACPRSADGELEPVTYVPLDNDASCVKAAGRVGGRQSLLEALVDSHVHETATLMHVVAAHLSLRAAHAVAALDRARAALSCQARIRIKAWDLFRCSLPGFSRSA